MLFKNYPKKRFIPKPFCLGISLLFLNAINVSAALVLTITAESPSATQITITAGSGTNTIEAGGVNPQTSVSNGRLPVGTLWSGNTGNMNITTLDSESGFSTSNFSNVTSTLQYTYNGTPFGVVLNEIETYQSSQHEFRVGPGSSMSYPQMFEGDTYGFTGSATFNLTGGMTAAAFTNGSLDNPIHGGNFTWVVSVPEPSTYAILVGGIALLFVGYRKASRYRCRDFQ